MTLVGPFVTNKQLILASGSPRRRTFLEDLGLEFEVRVADIPEDPLPAESPYEFVRRLAAEKAETISARFDSYWVLAADTVVVLDDEILGKPENEDHAVSMLMRMAGRRHEVLTGFCICCAAESVMIRQAVSTSVYFTNFSEATAVAYVNTKEPLDKAGSYGIQGRGGILVEKINGSYSNVVGLPLSEVIGELMRFGIVNPALPFSKSERRWPV